MTTTVHYHSGDVIGIKTGIILACPGRLEAKRCRPAAAASGNNLDTLLGFLGRREPTMFPYEDRYTYVISNSSDKVHYKGLTGDTVPSYSQILDPANLTRLMNEVGHCSTILALGEHALTALELLASRGFRPTVISGGHPSMSNLNRNITHDIDGELIVKGSSGATRRRIEVLASRMGEHAKVWGMIRPRWREPVLGCRGGEGERGGGATPRRSPVMVG